jgi:hypothetical protein
METNFLLREIDFLARRNGPETQDCNPCRVINNGVDSHDHHSPADLSRILPGLPPEFEVFLADRSDAPATVNSSPDSSCDRPHRNSDLARRRAAQDFRATLQRSPDRRLDQVVALNS